MKSALLILMMSATSQALPFAASMRSTFTYLCTPSPESTYIVQSAGQEVQKAAIEPKILTFEYTARIFEELRIAPAQDSGNMPPSSIAKFYEFPKVVSLNNSEFYYEFDDTLSSRYDKFTHQILISEDMWTGKAKKGLRVIEHLDRTHSYHRDRTPTEHSKLDAIFNCEQK